MTALVIVEAVAIALLAVLVAGLLRSHAEILRRLHELGVGMEESPAPGRGPAVPRLPEPRVAGSPAADLVGRRLGGGTVQMALREGSHRTLLAFLSTGCASCAAFWEAFARAPELPGEDTRLVIVAKDLDQESPSRLEELAPEEVPVVLSTQAWEDYRVPVTPYFVLVDASQGRVLGEGSAATWPQVRSLIEEAAADAEMAGRRRGSREVRADRELLRAGIAPGHPSLYPERAPQEHHHG